MSTLTADQRDDVRGDFGIDTAGSLDDTRRGVDDVWRQITAAVD